mgnify:CR=1 FL=1
MNKETYYQKITILIVLYKEDYNLIYRTLDKIRSFKKIIIDNANNVDLMKKIRSEFFIDEYILNKKNNGFSAGYNQAVKLNNTEFSLSFGDSGLGVTYGDYEDTGKYSLISYDLPITLAGLSISIGWSDFDAEAEGADEDTFVVTFSM